MQVGFVDGRRACVRGGRAGHLPNRPDGVVRRGSSSGVLGKSLSAIDADWLGLRVSARNGRKPTLRGVREFR